MPVRSINAANPVADHPLNRGLTAWWLGLPNIAGGSRLFDLGGRYPGTLTNGPTWRPAADPGFFNGLDFDGANDYVTFGTSWAPLQGDFTLSMWLRPDTWASGVGEFSGILSKRSAFASMAWELFYNDSSQSVDQGTAEGLAWASGNSLSNGTIGFGVVPPLGSWSHVALTRSGNTYVCYLNGVTGSTETRAGVVPGGSDQVVMGVLGSELAGTAAYHYNGQISDVRVYDGRALSASAVWGLYDQGRRGNPDTLRTYSPLRRLDLIPPNRGSGSVFLLRG